MLGSEDHDASLPDNRSWTH